MKKRWIWGVLIALCMMLGMTAAAAEGTPAKVTFKANGRTTTVNVSLPHTFEGNRDKEQDELDRIIRYLYGYNEGVCEVDSAPVATGNPKVKAGLIIDGNENKKGHYITIDGVFAGTATVKGYYLAGSNYFQYSLEITATLRHPHNYATEWSKDASGHWHACTGAGECDKPKADAAPHSYGTGGDARFTCQCGYVDTAKKDEVLAADRTAADTVIRLINEIGTVEFTYECQSKINAARKAYDALTDDQKRLVTNYDALTTAEGRFEQLKDAKESITILKKPSIKTLRAKKGGIITVSWKNFKRGSGIEKKIWKKIKKIEVQCSRKSTFLFEHTIKKWVGKTKTKVQIKGLEKGISYCVRVRYCDGAGGYSEWSKVRKIKPK